jgi:hypothetical protein
MCRDPASRPRLADSVAVVATVLVAALGAFATVVGASVAEPPAAHLVAVAPAAPR